LLLGSYPVVQALHLQQPALLVAALMAAAIAAVTWRAYWLSGIALGLAMIKPQTAGPLVAWLMLWAVSNWKERKLLALAFAVVMAALLAGSELLLPNWLWEWRDATAAYMRYTGSAVPAHVQLLYGAYAGGIIRVLLIVAAAVFCWVARKDSTSSDRFKLAPALLLAVTLAVSPIWHEYDLMFLLPAVLLVFQWRHEAKGLSPIQVAIAGLAAIGLGWQWIAAAALSIIAFSSPQLARSLQILPWLSVFFGPTLGLVLLGLVAGGRWRRVQ
jgi:hypothetical protein